MIKRLLTIATILLSGNVVFAQMSGLIFIIYDKDNYVNVRESDKDSEITGKIGLYQPFFIAGEIPGMYEVWYPSHYKKQPDGYLKSTAESVGYVHQSRVLCLDKLPALPQRKMLKQQLVLSNDTISVAIQTRKFDPGKHTIKKRITESEFTYTIDGVEVWGTDGDMPGTEITSIVVKHHENEYRLPASSLKNLFEPNLEDTYTTCYMGNAGELYILMHNSDGAGGYTVCWVIINSELYTMSLFRCF